MMDRARFFGALRGTALFSGGLSQPQVDGINAILDSAARNGLTDIHHVSNVLAQVYRETGGNMLGIKETVMPYHKDKNPSDATVISRLNRAWKAGKLGKVRKPYWQDGAFGRGPIQLTHWSNYSKFGKRLGVDLRKNPSLALDPDIGADIAVIGMKEGMFRTFGLSDYRFPHDLDNAPTTNPRRIVNGNDGSDKEVAANHRVFHGALVAAGWGTKPAAVPPQRPQETREASPTPKDTGQGKTAPVKPQGGKTGIFAIIIAAVVAAGAAVANWFCSIPFLERMCS